MLLPDFFGCAGLRHPESLVVRLHVVWHVVLDCKKPLQNSNQKVGPTNFVMPVG
jgi:hypothetical protein